MSDAEGNTTAIEVAARIFTRCGNTTAIEVAARISRAAGGTPLFEPPQAASSGSRACVKTGLRPGLHFEKWLAPFEKWLAPFEHLLKSGWHL